MRFLIVLAGLAWAQLSGAQGMQWPLPVQHRNIAHAFGQYQEAFGVRNLHEGIDIPAPVGTAVNFFGNGRVKKVEWNPATPADGIVEVLEGNKLWRYLHVQPRQNLAVGVAIGGAQPNVGRVAPFLGNIAPHLHLDVVIGGLHDDPLLHLADRAQKQAPVAPSTVLYRTSNGSRYFDRGKTCSGRLVIRADVDIVAPATDTFLAPPSTASVHALAFEVMRGPTSLIKETSFRFGTGQRNIQLADGDKGQDLVPVFYAQDATAKTIDQDPGGNLFGQHEFYYYLTNIGDDRAVIAPADANKYWNTKVLEATDTRWNTPARLARMNAEARFYDHGYTVFVRSVDENNASAEVRSDIFINNFSELLIVGVVVGNQQLQPQEEFAPGAQIFVGGRGYPKARPYDIHLMTGQNLTECGALSGQIVATVTTDNAGNIPTTPINLPAPGPGGHPPFYRLVLDYDADGKNTGLREGRTVDVPSKPFSVGQ